MWEILCIYAPTLSYSETWGFSLQFSSIDQIAIGPGTQIAQCIRVSKAGGYKWLQMALVFVASISGEGISWPIKEKHKGGNT